MYIWQKSGGHVQKCSWKIEYPVFYKREKHAAFYFILIVMCKVIFDFLSGYSVKLFCKDV